MIVFDTYLLAYHAEQKEWLHTFYLSERVCGLDMLKLFLLKELHLNRQFHLNNDKKRRKNSIDTGRKRNPALPSKPMPLEALIPIFINREFLKRGDDNFLNKIFRLW